MRTRWRCGGRRTARRLRGKSFLIATGSSLKIVDIPGLKETGFLDSDTVLESAHIPKSVVMLGAGPIALEFAHYYSALGSEVTIVQRGSQVLRDMDGDVAMAASDALCARGVRLYLGTTLTRVEKCEGGKRVIFQHEGGEQSGGGGGDRVRAGAGAEYRGAGAGGGGGEGGTGAAGDERAGSRRACRISSRRGTPLGRMRSSISRSSRRKWRCGMRTGWYRGEAREGIF